MHNQYKQEHCLGKGGFSDVFKVVINDKPYALKKIRSHILKDPFYKASIFRQIQIMKQIDHPNIIKLYDVIQTEGQISLLLQYADGGSLFDLLHVQGKFSEQIAKKYVKDVVKALKYLHSRKQPILHRDIKPQNILICGKQVCKLADFGCSNVLDSQRKTFTGTKQYMAPQIVLNMPYDQSIDLWCLGVLIYEILVGHIPQNGVNQQIQFPPFMSRPAQDVLRKLLIKNPKERMTISQLQSHIWFASDEQINQSQTQVQTKKKAQIKLKNIKEKNKCLMQKLKETLSKQKDKTTKLNLQKSQSFEYSQMIKNKANIQSQADIYMKMLKLKAELKIQIQQNQILIKAKKKDIKQQIPYQQEYITRLRSKISEDTKNIDLLRKGQPKFVYECYENFEELMKKIQLLQEYVQLIPQHFVEDVLMFPQFQQKQEPLPLSQYIFKLKTCMLQCKRDALIQLLTIKKRRKCMNQITMLEQCSQLQEETEQI